MQLNWIQSLLYGFVSGFAEFLPISSRAHQDVLLNLFGYTQHDPVRDLLIHIVVLLSLFSCCKDLFSQFRRENRQKVHNYRGHRNTQNAYVLRLIRTALFPMLIGLIFVSYIYKGDMNLLISSLFLLVNGIILYIPCRMLQGNKDASAMSVFDGWLIGLASALSAFGGISRIGCGVSAGMIRGADRKKALNWALILSVPALIFLSVSDLLGIFIDNSQISFWANFFGYVLSIIGAAIGGYLSVLLIRFVTNRMNYVGFAYYSWGFALFTFIMYLVIV